MAQITLQVNFIYFAQQSIYFLLRIFTAIISIAYMFQYHYLADEFFMGKLR